MKSLLRWLLHSLQGRMLGALIPLAGIPVLVAAFQGYHCAREAVLDLVQKHLVSVAMARDAAIRDWYGERSNDIALVVSIPELAEATERLASHSDPARADYLTSLLTDIQSKDQAFESLSVYGPAWQFLAKSNLNNHAERDLVTDEMRQALQDSDGIVVEEPHMHGRHDVGVHIGQVITTRDGVKAGYLVGNLSLTRSLAPLLQQRSGLMNSGKTYLATSDGQIISEPFPKGERIAFVKRVPAVLLNSLKRGKPAMHAYVDYAGRGVLGTAVTLPIGKWILVAEVDRGEALDWLDRLIFRASMTVLATLVAVFVVSMWLSKLLGRPMRKLAATANRIRGGQAGERVPAMQLIEADELGQAFNQMLDELRDQQDLIVRTATLANMGEITSSIVHEMRNPLSSIKMNLQALTRSLASGDRNQEVAHIASTQITRIENMLTDLLQLGRPIAIRRVDTTFADLVRMSLDVAGDQLQNKGIQCNIENGSGDAGLWVDKEQMCRALSNLLANAAQASPPHSTICLRVQPSSRGSRFLDIEVLDSGPGLSPAAQKKLFQPFFTTKPGGTGLGLANVKKILDLHGGQVSAGNRPEGGAWFCLTLPRSSPAAPVSTVQAVN